MLSSRSLIRVQKALVAFCYLALLGAAVAMLSGGGKKLAFILGAGGTIFAVLSLGIGALVKRAIAMEANPFFNLAKLYQQASRRPPPVYPVRITIRPVSGDGARYIVAICNTGKDIFTNGSLDHSQLLHPGKFGLDDTHMPANIWCQAPVLFQSLAPGDELTFEVQGYNVLGEYDGPRETRVHFAATYFNGVEPITSNTITAGVSMAW